MTLNKLVEQLCGVKAIYWTDDGAVFGDAAISDLFEHLMDVIKTDHLDDETGKLDWKAAKNTVIYLAEQTKAFQEWAAVDGRMPDE